MSLQRTKTLPAKRAIGILLSAMMWLPWSPSAQAEASQEKAAAQAEAPQETDALDEMLKELEGAALELAKAAKKDVNSIELDRRWALVDVRVIDATGNGIDKYAISGPLHAAMTVNSSYGWKGTRWKFIVKSDTGKGTELHKFAYVHNAAPSVTDELKKTLGTVAPNETVAVILYVVVLPNGDLNYITLGFYKTRRGKTKPVFRAFTGSIKRGADEVLRLCKAAQ